MKSFANASKRRITNDLHRFYYKLVGKIKALIIVYDKQIGIIIALHLQRWSGEHLNRSLINPKDH